MIDAVELDRRFTAAAIRLGQSGLGTTWPNPAVGAIVVKDGRVVGRARTARGGRPHAESAALQQAGEAARGATIYVSLEPCSHHGRTPPCADAIVEAGVSRVVAAIADRNPVVRDQGFERLRAAGLVVVSGVHAAQAEQAHAGHSSRMERGRPYVTLKLAVSADGAIGRVGGRQVEVTGAEARRYVQALRSRSDAILVGRGTVAADDPRLDCRLPGLEDRSPVRVILDSDGQLGERLNVFAGSAPTWVLTARGAEEAGGIRRRLVVPRLGSGLDLKAALERLGSEGISRILVEGGARVARALLNADLVDEVLLFRSPRVLAGDIVPALAGLPLSAIESNARFRPTERRMFGKDQMTRYERSR